MDLHPQKVGLELKQEVVGGGAAVHAHEVHLAIQVAAHGLDHVSYLEGDALQGRPRQVRLGGAAGDARDDAPGVRVPAWRAKTHERRHKDHTF